MPGAALGSEVPRREKSMGVVAGFSGSMSGMGPRLPATMATMATIAWEGHEMP